MGQDRMIPSFYAISSYALAYNGPIIQEYFGSIPAISSKANKNLITGVVEVISATPVYCYYGGFLPQHQAVQVLSNHSCTVIQDVGCARDAVLDTLVYQPTDTTSPIGPSALWFEADSSRIQPIHTGTTNVRGVDADVWEFCLDRPEPMKATFYASIEKWHGVSANIGDGIQTPLAINLFGKFEKKVINWTYHFYDFKKVVPLSIFNIPTGNGCPGMPPAKNFPKIPDSVSFRALGVLKNHAQAVHSISVNINRKDKTVDLSLLENHRWTELFQDYQEGVTYKLLYDYHSRDPTICKVQPIGDVLGTNSGHIPFLMNTYKVFTQGKPPYYLGQGWINNIEVDIFEYVLLNEQLGTPLVGKFHKYDRLVVTFYFDRSDVEYTGDDSFEANRALIAIDYTAYLKKRFLGTARLRIFKWRETPISDKTLIYDCFYKSKLRVSLLVKNDFLNHSYLTTHRVYTADSVKQYISSKYGVSTVRIANFEPHLQSGYYFIDFDIMPAPPVMAMFSTSMKGFPKEPRTSGTHVSLTACAQACINQDAHEAKCLSFYHCIDGSRQICYLSKSTSVNNIPTGNQKKCPFYRAGSMNITKPLIKNKDLFNHLKEDAKQGRFVITAKIGSGSSFKDVKLIISHISDVIPHQSKAYEAPLNYAKIKNGYSLKSLTGGSDLFDTTLASQEQCIRHCNMVGSCESVSYCVGTHKCIGTTLRIDDVSSSKTAKYIEKKTNCALFNRPYSGDYYIYKGNTKMKPSYNETNVKTVDSCAQKCTKQSGFLCKLFQYCPSNQDCFLFNQTDSGVYHRSEVVTDCTFGYRTYQSAFRYTNNENASQYSGEYIRGLSYSNCSEICYFNKNCMGFDICGRNLNFICIIHQDVEDSTKTHQMKPTMCSKFTRTVSKSGSNVPGFAALKAPVNKGISSGGLAGLAIGMLIVGTIAIVGIFFGVQAMKKRNSSGGGGDISIMYSKQDD